MTEKLTFDDILDDLMMEEDKPTAEALGRWQERYPQYRQSLADFFETWADQEARSDLPLPEIDEERLVQKGVEYAMEILRKQGRLLPADYTPSIDPFDEQVLAAVYALQGQGYPVNIGEKVGDMSDNRPMLGTVLTSLDRLESKYLVMGRDVPADGKIRRYFTLTLSGEKVLMRVKEASPVVARFLADFA
jgi:hypothetical protein